MGGRGGWLGFEVGDDTGVGEVAGDEAADMTVDMLDERWVRMFGYVACDVAEAIAPEKSQCFEGFPVIDSYAAKDDVSILKRSVRRRGALVAGCRRSNCKCLRNAVAGIPYVVQRGG